MMNKEHFQFLLPLYRGWFFVILAVVVAVLLAQKYLYYTTPIYESTAKIKLANINEGESSANLFKDFDVFVTSNKIQTEIEVLKSSTLLEKVLQKIQFTTEIYRKGDVRTEELYYNAPIVIKTTNNNSKNKDTRFQLNLISTTDFTITAPHVSEVVNGKINKPIVFEKDTIIISLNSDYIKSKPDLKIVDQYEFELLSKEKAFAKITQHLDVVAVDKEVPVVRINYKSSVPEKAAIIVNTLAETYIEDYIENKVKAATTAVTFLENEIDLARQKLSETEINLQDFKDKHNIINITQETETDLRKIAQLKIQRSNIKMNLDAVKDLNNYIASSDGDLSNLSINFEAFNDLLSTEIIKKIKQLKAEQKELLLYYTPEHEKVTVIEDKIKDLTQYQIESVKNTERNLQIKFNDIDKDIALAETVFIGLPEKERMLTILNREFNLYQNTYNFLNEKRIEAEISRSAKVSFHRIITKGEIPKKPVAPVRIIVVAVALFSALFVSVSILYLIAFVKGKVTDNSSIEKNTAISVVIETPFLENEEEVQNFFKQSILALELKEIFAPHKAISFTAIEQQEVSFFYIKHFFEIFTKLGKKVAIVDVAQNFTHLKSPHIYSFSPEEIMQLSVRKIETKIKEIKNQYEWCFINNKVLKDKTEATLFMLLSDENLVVLEHQKTTVKQLNEITQLKEEFMLPNLSFVSNKNFPKKEFINRAKRFIKTKF